MVNDADLKKTEILSIERIKGFLTDKVIQKLYFDMKSKGVPLSMPVLCDLKNNDDKDFQFKTLRKISYYIKQYNK